MSLEQLRTYWGWALLLPLAGWNAVSATEPIVIEWQNIRLTDSFYAEGACIADFNRDGVGDLCVGPLIYEGPNFHMRREIAPVVSVDPHAYSELAFLSFADDVDGDGWVDIIHCGWPGKETVWFRNPGTERNTLTDATRGHWDRFVVFAVTDNESPVVADLTGDGQVELVCSTAGAFGYAQRDPADPTKPWTFHHIGENRNLGRYTHGLGVGDVNNDGLPDLLEKDGWYQNPGPDAGDELWKHHPVAFSDGRGGAQMFAYDIDGDGDHDVLASLNGHGFGLAWFENTTGKASSEEIKFKKHMIIGEKPEENPFGVKFSQLHGLALVDIDGDGLLDVVTGKRFWAHGPKGDPEPAALPVLYWFKLTRSENGDEGTAVEFIPHLIHEASGVGCQVTVGDVNGDGLLDVAVGNKLGTFVHLQTRRHVTQTEYDAARPKRLQ